MRIQKYDRRKTNRLLRFRKTTDEKKEKRIAAEVIEEKNNTYDQFKRKENFSYSVLVENKEQLSAVCAYLEKRETENIKIARIYAESNIFQEDIPGYIEKLKKKKIEFYLALPHVFRKGSAERIEKCISRFSEKELDGVLIRNWEQYTLLCQLQFDKKVISDDNLYVFNRFSKEFMKKAGFSEFTAPAELNESELKILGLETAELTVYGYRPVMISAQCIMKTRGKCTKNSSFTHMKDRIGEEFLVQNRCDECYNIVYNSAPLYLGTQKVKIQKLSPKRLRVRFGAERKEEVKKVLEQAIDAFGEKPQFDYTQEHFKRGVL